MTDDSIPTGSRFTIEDHRAADELFAQLGSAAIDVARQNALAACEDVGRAAEVQHLTNVFIILVETEKLADNTRQ